MIYDCLCIRDRDQTGEGHLCVMGLGELNGNFGGGGQMQYRGTLKHKKTNFQFLGFISEEQGNRYPHPHGRASYRKLLEKHT